MGYVIAPPDFLAALASQDGALGQRDAADRNEGNDVGGANAGVHSTLCGQIDERRRLASGANGRFDHRRGWSGNGDHRTIVVAIERPIQQGNPVYTHGVHDSPHFIVIAALGKVGHALDDGFAHRGSLPPRIADGKLHACVHPGIRISHAGIRDMNRIGGDENRLPRPDEVMYAYPKLRSVIKNAGAQMVGYGIRTYRRELVIGPDEATRTLNPGTKAV